MFETLLGNTRHPEPGYIPPPEDLSDVVLNIAPLTSLYGRQTQDHLGNQFQFNYNGTMLLASCYGRAVTELRSINIDAADYSIVRELPIAGGAAASDTFHVLYNFRPLSAPSDGFAQGTRFVRETDGSYTAEQAPAINMDSIDNYQCSSKGNLVYGSNGVFRILPTGYFEKVIDTGADVILGAVFSEDESTITVVGRNVFFLKRYVINPDKTYSLESTSTFNYAHNFPYGSNETGMEAGINIDISLIAIPTTGGLVMFKLNDISKEYEVAQTLPYPASNMAAYPSVSMDRSGHLIAFCRWQSNVVLYRRQPDGLFTLAHTFDKVGSGAHKVKMCPDGSILGFDIVFNSVPVSNAGGISLHKLYDK